MKIGIDISVLNMQKTGVGSYSLSLYKHLLKNDRKNEYKLFFFSMQKEGLAKEIVKEFDYPYVDLIQYNLGKGVLNRGWWYLPKSLGKYFYRNIDLFHFSDTLVMYPQNVPTLATIYDMTPELFPQFHTTANNRFHANRNSVVKKHAQHIVTISESSKKDIHKLLHIPKRDISVIYGAASKQFNPQSRKKELNLTLRRYRLIYQKYFLYLGTIEPRKNLGTALQSFSLIKENLPNDYKFVIAGAKGWDWENIKKLIRNYNLNKSLVVTGYVKDSEIPFLIKGCTAFVYPSFYEGFGLPVLEAMQSAIPVVTTNTSSIPEVVGKSVPLFDPKDVSGIALFMKKLATNEKQRTLYAKKCFKTSQNFSWNISAQKLLDTYMHVYRKYS